MNEAQALTLEAGKYYRTRDGKKAFVAGKNPFEDLEYPFIGVLQSDASSSDSWAVDGRYIVGEKSNDDLVAEWVEPKRVTGWIAMLVDGYTGDYPAHTTHVFATRQEAVESFNGAPFAVIEIDVLEGHGLNGEAA